jgi:hypothetical protein
LAELTESYYSFPIEEKYEDDDIENLYNKFKKLCIERISKNDDLPQTFIHHCFMQKHESEHKSKPTENMQQVVGLAESPFYSEDDSG